MQGAGGGAWWVAGAGLLGCWAAAPQGAGCMTALAQEAVDMGRRWELCTMRHHTTISVGTRCHLPIRLLDARGCTY